MTAAALPAARPARPSKLRRKASIVAVLILVSWALISIGIDPVRLVRLPGQLVEIASRMFPPDVAYFGTAWAGMVESLQMAWIGTILGALFSLPLGFFGARNVSSGIVSTVIRQVLNAVRAVPEIVLAILIVTVVGLGPIAGALAIGIHSIGTLGKLTAEVIEGIDPGPVEAARATGGNGIQVQRWGVLPQVMPEIVAFWLYRFEINIRASAILGVVGAGGIGESLTQAMAFNRLPRAGVIIIVIIVATILIDTASGWLRRRIIEGGAARRLQAESLDQPELVDVAARG